MLFPHWTPPVAPEILLNTQFFLLYPFDGGGNFIHQDMLGTLDDLEITDRIMHKGALKDFGEYPNLDFRKYERWSTIEKDSWINRIYFAAALGHAYALTKDTAIATGLKELLLGFARKYPAPLEKDAIDLEQRGDRIHMVRLSASKPRHQHPQRLLVHEGNRGIQSR